MGFPFVCAKKKKVFFLLLYPSDEQETRITSRFLFPGVTLRRADTHPHPARSKEESISTFLPSGEVRGGVKAERTEGGPPRDGGWLTVGVTCAAQGRIRRRVYWTQDSPNNEKK